MRTLTAIILFGIIVGLMMIALLTSGYAIEVITKDTYALVHYICLLSILAIGSIIFQGDTNKKPKKKKVKK